MCKVQVVVFGCCKKVIHELYWDRCTNPDCTNTTETHEFDMDKCEVCGFLKENMVARKRELALQAEEKEIEKMMAGMKMDVDEMEVDSK